MGKLFYKGPIRRGDFGLYILDCILRLRFFPGAPGLRMTRKRKA
jgi:hypothetical protein